MKREGADKASRLFGILRFLVAIMPVTVIACPHNYKKIVIYVLVSVIVCVIGGVQDTFTNRKFICKKLIVLDVFIVSILCASFWHEFGATHVLDPLANKINVSGKGIIKVIILVCGIMAIPGVDFILTTIAIPLLVRMRKLFHFCGIEDSVVSVFLMGMLEYIQLNFSVIQSVHSVFTRNIFILICNILIIVSVNALLKNIVRRKKIMMVVSGLFFTMWSIGNYYVFMYHGNPILPSELLNFNTALNVASTYKISFSIVTFTILLFFPIELCYVIFYEKVFKNETDQNVKGYSLQKKNWKKVVTVSLILGAYIVVVCTICLKTDIRAWSITECTKNYGYMITVLDDFIKTTNTVEKPKNYSITALEGTFGDNRESGRIDLEDQYPDIILILNETFCDISKFVDVGTDIDYMENYYNIEGAFYGNCVVPEIGGGTNNSEFELLTSNAMYLMNIQSPFNYWATFRSESIVNYLEKFGYITTGMHCENPDNYARRYVYPELGFDNIFFKDDFKYANYYGNRYWLDADNYHDLKDIYDINSTSPQFMYILTFQNHGGYEQNEQEYDIVHIKNEYGNLTDDMNEYLSSIKLSADAFHDLTDFFESVQRHVVICMVGDHAPAFISDLPMENGMDDMEEEIVKRTVPYVMWSNFDVDFEDASEYASMVDLLPILLKSSDIPLSTYYETILEVNQTIPVRIRTGLCMNNMGEFFMYGSGFQEDDGIKLYYDMEYNQLKGRKNYMEELFMPYTVIY